MMKTKTTRMIRTKVSKMKTDSSIADAMAALLNPAAVQKKASVQNAEDAVASLNAAAEILDNMGLFVVAEAVTQVMESVPGSLNKTAQRHGLGALKYMIYLIEQTATDMNALIPNASELSGKKTTNITSKQRTLIEGTEIVKGHVGKLLAKLDSWDDVSDLDLRELVEQVGELGAVTLDMAGDAFNYFQPADQSLPEHVRELAGLVDIYGSGDTAAFVAELEKRKNQAEEETGKDFDAPGAEHERFKEHEYMPEDPGEEEDAMVEGYDDYWDEDARFHPDHPLYRD
jgi:hypothetical protein